MPSRSFSDPPFIPPLLPLLGRINPELFDMVVFPSSQTSLASKKLTCSLHSIFSCNSSKSDDCVEYLLDLLSSSTLFNLRTERSYNFQTLGQSNVWTEPVQQIPPPSNIVDDIFHNWILDIIIRRQIIQMPTFQSVGKTRNAKTLFVQMTANTGIHERRKLKQLQQTRMLQESRVLLLNLQYISLLIKGGECIILSFRVKL